MKRILVPLLVVVVSSLLAPHPSWAQKGGGSGNGGSSGSGSSGSGSSGSGSSAPSSNGGRISQPVNPGQQVQNTLILTGRVLPDGTQQAPNPISVALYCGARALRSIHTDMKGYFTITFGQGLQSDSDFSAADDSPISSNGNQIGFPGGNFGGSGNSLTGCELRISASGFRPFTRTIYEPADLSRIDVGTLHISPLAVAPGSSVSVSSLLAPASARKEFEAGEKDASNNKLPAATQHLEKAVANYAKYAEAWNELGRLYAQGHQDDKAVDAFQKAIAADATFVSPYLGLGNLYLNQEKYADAVTVATKAHDLDSGSQFANFILAIGNFGLDRLDTAEQNARDAEKGSQEIPQLHAMLAEIYIRKKDNVDAVTEMQTYLKVAPKGEYADHIRQILDQVSPSATTAQAPAPAAAAPSPAAAQASPTAGAPPAADQPPSK